MILLLLVALMLPFPAHAQESPSVLLNEIAWMGTVVEGVDANQHWRYEWLELFNPGSAAVSVEGWLLELWREEIEFSIELAGTVPSQGYMLVAASDRIPDYDINYANLGGKFFNGGLMVLLKDRTGAVVERLDARDGWFAGDNTAKQTMERRFAELPADDPANWGTSRKVGGTPKVGNTAAGISLAEEEERKNSAGSAESFSDFKASTLVTDSPFPLAVGFGLASAAVVLWIRSRLPLQA